MQHKYDSIPLNWCWHSCAPNIWPAPSAINASGTSAHNCRWIDDKPGTRLQIIDEVKLHTILETIKKKLIKFKYFLNLIYFYKFIKQNANKSHWLLPVKSIPLTIKKKTARKPKRYSSTTRIHQYTTINMQLFINRGKKMCFQSTPRHRHWNSIGNSRMPSFAF